MGLLDRLLNRSGAEALPPPDYTNDSVIGRIADEQGIDRATARVWFGEMLIFLDLCAHSDRVLSPPPEVDRAWHAFLLHTRDYEAYCTERFGRLIHHQPAGQPDEDAYARAYRRRRDYGGSPGVEQMIWATPTGFSDDDGRDGHRDGSASGGVAGSACGSGGDSGGGDSGGSSGGGDSGGSSCGGSSCGGSSCGGGGS